MSITVLKSEDKSSMTPRWRHYLIIDTQTVTLVEMAPVLFGWNVHKVNTAPMTRDWPDMSAADVVAWKLQNHDVSICDVNESDRIRALARAKATT